MSEIGKSFRSRVKLIPYIIDMCHFPAWCEALIEWGKYWLAHLIHRIPTCSSHTPHPDLLPSHTASHLLPSHTASRPAHLPLTYRIPTCSSSLHTLQPELRPPSLRTQARFQCLPPGVARPGPVRCRCNHPQCSSNCRRERRSNFPPCRLPDLH